MKLAHLARRYWRSLRAQSLDPTEERWVRDRLLVGEQQLFDSMSTADQRHHWEVAHRLCDSLPGDAPRAWCAAALLHDVGKVTAGMGTHRRVLATMLRFRRGDHAVARYHRHEDIGASLLLAAGSDHETIALVGHWPDAPEQALEHLLRADEI